MSDDKKQEALDLYHLGSALPSKPNRIEVVDRLVVTGKWKLQDGFSEEFEKKKEELEPKTLAIYDTSSGSAKEQPSGKSIERRSLARGWCMNYVACESSKVVPPTLNGQIVPTEIPLRRKRHGPNQEE